MQQWRHIFISIWVDLSLPTSSRQGSFYFNRGLVLFDMEEYEAAIKDFTSTIQARKSLFRAHFNRGNCFRKLGRLGM